ncbi:hypothetical protein GCM10023352_09270 [Rothia endophytica]|uniref:Uncharacterized protein n=1 Tax=Rothia endophytica TaxID=1324766 RepID=A0ABP9BAT8_9MICC
MQTLTAQHAVVQGHAHFVKTTKFYPPDFEIFCPCPWFTPRQGLINNQDLNLHSNI